MIWDGARYRSNFGWRMSRWASFVTEITQPMFGHRMFGKVGLMPRAERPTSATWASDLPARLAAMMARMAALDSWNGLSLGSGR